MIADPDYWSDQRYDDAIFAECEQRTGPCICGMHATTVLAAADVADTEGRNQT